MVAKAPLGEVIPVAQPSENPHLGTEPLLTVADVAEYLRLKPETVRVMARRGELRSIKLGKRLRRFRMSDVKDWLNIHMEGGKD